MYKRSPGIEFKYKGKRYFFSFLGTGPKGPKKIRPIDEPDNERPATEIGNRPDEITVKDYKEGFWNTTLYINNEAVTIGWGLGKHLTVWGAPALTVTVAIILLWRYYSIKKKNYYKNALLRRFRPRKP